MAERLTARTGVSFVLVDRKEDLTRERLAAIGPSYVFVPHWSWIIPDEVYENYECVIFHMTDLPFGRGGSPLQNLIARGIYQTKISALKCARELDAGPIYMKKDFSIAAGSAEEIYFRAAEVIEEMIVEILAQNPNPVPQIGTPVVFERRKPKDGDIAMLTTLDQVYDYIRMLDAEGYPPAFLEVGPFRIEFLKALRQGDEVTANVSIKLEGKKQ